MPATIVQSNSGGFSSTTGNATLSATTAGNTLLLIVGTASSNTSPNPPTGFTPASGEGPTPAANRAFLFRKSDVSAGETSWTISVSVSQLVCWSVLEVEGLDLSTPKDVAVATFQNGTGVTSQSTGTSPLSTTYDAFVLAVWMGNNVTNTTIPTWSGHTNGFEEVTDAGVAGASTAAGMSVAVLDSQSLSTFTSTATASVTVNTGATLIVYSCAGAKRVANVINMAGFEWGTAAGLATGTGAGFGNQIFDSIGGTPAIVSTSPRSGSYCLELSSSAAAEYVQWSGTSSVGSSVDAFVARFSVYFPSSLPSGDLDLAYFSTALGTLLTNAAVTLRYRSSSQKLGVQARDVLGTNGNGTEQLSASTVAADTWYALDLHYNSVAATYVVNWQLDGVAQTQATVVGSTGPSQPATAVSFGSLQAATFTVRYDDIVISRTAGHYPLGDFRILPLKPDPAGTLTISGTAGNFNTFTANGTMAAWNAATALAAIDDLPPTIGASADGIAQITLAASDYVEIPMETYDGVANAAAVRGVRMYACGWAASTTAATIGFRAWEGTAETTLLAAADPEFDNSTTTPAWVCKMYKPTGGWTQTKLDNLAFRVGFSGDATPDIGIHSIMAEVAVRSYATETIMGEAGAIETTAGKDPDSAAILSVTVDTADVGATLRWTDTAGSGSQAVAPSSSYTEPMSAIDATGVSVVDVESDPEFTERE